MLITAGRSVNGFLFSGRMTAADAFDLLQWPAMIVTIVASWFVTSRYKGNRWLGFCLFVLSNILWAVWGIHTKAHALVVLQALLLILNLVGIKRTNAKADEGSSGGTGEQQG